MADQDALNLVAYGRWVPPAATLELGCCTSWNPTRIRYPPTRSASSTSSARNKPLDRAARGAATARTRYHAPRRRSRRQTTITLTGHGDELTARVWLGLMMLSTRVGWRRQGRVSG